MKRIGQNQVYFTGSKFTKFRSIVTDGQKYFCKWYGKYIEVEKTLNGFRTVEAY